MVGILRHNRDVLWCPAGRDGKKSRYMQYTQVSVFSWYAGMDYEDDSGMLI